jgi:hypothetical protein
MRARPTKAARLRTQEVSGHAALMLGDAKEFAMCGPSKAGGVLDYREAEVETGRRAALIGAGQEA